MLFVKVKDKIIVGEYIQGAPELYSLGRGKYFDATNKQIVDGLQLISRGQVPDLKNAKKLEYIGSAEANRHLYKANRKCCVLYDCKYFISALSYKSGIGSSYFENDNVVIYYYRSLGHFKNYDNFVIIWEFGIVDVYTGEVYRMDLLGVNSSIIEQALASNRIKELGRLIKIREVVPYINVALGSDEVKLDSLIRYMYKHGARAALMGVSDVVYRFEKAYDLAKSNNELPEYCFKTDLVVEKILCDKSRVIVWFDRFKIIYVDRLVFDAGCDCMADFTFFRENSLCGIMSDKKEDEIVRNWAILLRKVGCDKVRFISN